MSYLRLLFLGLLLFPSAALAELPSQIKTDFTPLDTYLVMPIDKQFLIDVDASKGVQVGDIFSNIAQGQKIIHPVTGEVIGNLDGNKTFLQVTQIKSGYSYAQQLGKGLTPQKGQKFTRYKGVPSQFIDQTGQATALKNELEKELPQLAWQSSNHEETALLIFERTPASLLVKSGNGQVIGNFPLAVLTVDMRTDSLNTTKTLPISPAATSSIILAGQVPQQQGIIRNTSSSGVWHSAEINEDAIAIAAADLDQDGQIETAILTRNRLSIYRFNGQKSQVIATQKISAGLNPIALDIYPVANGVPILCLSALTNDLPNSSILQLQNGQLTTLLENIKYLLRRTDSPKNGPILLGQKRRNLDLAFHAKPVRLLYQNNTLTETDNLTLPAGINLYNFVQLQENIGDNLYVSFSSRDKLRVQNDQEITWESSEPFGGTETRFNLAPENVDIAPLPYFIPARIVTTAQNEVLTFQNDGSRTTERFRLYKKGRFIAMKWADVSLEESWRTTDQNGYIADFTLADIDNDGALEIASISQFKHGSIFGKARTAITVYELQ